MCMAIETPERSAPKLPLQVCSCTLPPVTRMEGMVVETLTMPDIQLMFAKLTRSSVRFVGCMLIGMDMGVNHSILEGGSGERGSSIAGAVNTARGSGGSLRDVTVI